MNTRLKQNLAGILITVGTIGVASAIAIAADYHFAGTWKGTYTAAAPTPGASAGGAAPTAGTASASGNVPASTDGASAAGGGFGGGGGRTKGGGGATGGGGFGGGGGFPSTGPQKITMRVKVNKEGDKATGNFTIGSASPEDIREGKIAGNKLTFKTGTPPAAIYDYDAVLIGEDLNVTRTAEGGKGGRPQTFTLKVSK